MKELKHYINEAFKINKNTKIKKYNYFPKTKDELIDIIKQRIEDDGNECDLNDIDVSEITDMSYLFVILILMVIYQDGMYQMLKI